MILAGSLSCTISFLKNSYAFVHAVFLCHEVKMKKKISGALIVETLACSSLNKESVHRMRNRNFDAFLPISVASIGPVPGML